MTPDEAAAIRREIVEIRVVLDWNQAQFEWLHEVGNEWLTEIEERGTPITKAETRALHATVDRMNRGRVVLDELKARAMRLDDRVRAFA